MKKEPSSYRHPKHDQIAELVRAGARDRAVAAQLGVHNRAVTRVRDILGISHHRNNATTREAKLARFSTPVDDGGHIGWTGRRATSGAPVIRHLKVQIPATHVAFEQRTGRPPVGIVKAECGRNYCLTPAHISDEIERRNVRGQERALYGLDPVPWTTCPKDLHEWDKHGRFEPDLTPYCKGCNSERAARVRAARKAEAAL
jgi:hypothetical protein